MLAMEVAVLSASWMYKRGYEAINYRLRTVAGGRLAVLCRPTTIIFLLTERCNARCIHCDIWKNRGQEDSPTGEQWGRVLDDLRAWLGPVQVSFSGGEALLKPYTVDLVAHARSLGLFLEVLTHGYWGDQSRIERLALANPWKITISVDGIGETHSRIRGREKFWERTSNTIDTLERIRREHRRDYTIWLKHVIMSHNLDDTLEVARFASRPGMAVFYQPIEQNYNTPDDPTWFMHSANWPADTERVVAIVRELIALKKAGLHIANSFAQLEAMIPYFRDPDAHRVATMSHTAHERKLPCSALTHLQFQANGDVVVCSGNPPVGNIRQASIRQIWETRPRVWEQGCCLGRRCTTRELTTIVPAESLGAAREWTVEP
jgi:MoaA/NifB/PqqE/SkfB family radical SAM enzyme